MNIVLELIKKYGLEFYLKCFLENNTAINAPYHNLYHTFCVIENCYKIAKDENISKPEIRLLLLAAIFHDFNHSQGKRYDEENVKMARKKFMNFSTESDDVNIEVIELILATQYPYVIPDEDLSLLQKIIRDADMMQLFEKNFIQQLWIGLLQQELDKSKKDAIEMQLKFMKSIKFYTPYAQRISNELLQNRIKTFEYIKTYL